MANLPERRRERYLSPMDLMSINMNRMLEDFFPSGVNGFDWLPSVDVVETKDAIEVRTELPGLTRENIDIQVANGVLTIKGEKKEQREEKETRYHHREVRYGSFVRSVTLPVDVKAENAAAQFKDGVLTISLPKEERAIHKKIEIKG